MKIAPETSPKDIFRIILKSILNYYLNCVLQPALLLPILAIVFLTSIEAFASLRIPTATEFRSGHQLCGKDYASLIAYQKGFYTSVPVDYTKPQGAHTDIYAYFSNGYDPRKETLFYFTGGPGLTGHWGLFPEPMFFNVLIMDQRGIACSRPDSLSEYLSPKFYSSEAVARDAEEIRRSLKINKFTVYGISYGTIPATMFGSLFPGSTRAVILEGTAGAGDGTLWSSGFLRQRLQQLFNGLPADIQVRLKKVNTQYGLPATWFFQMARDKLMVNDGFDSFRHDLLRISEDKRYQEFIQAARDLLAPGIENPHPLFVSNDIPYYMISCQELGMAVTGVKMYDALIDGVFVPQTDPESAQACQALKATSQALYAPEVFPIRGPTVTYFQGTDDSATPLPGALYHYQTVPQGPKQMLLLTLGGHNPNRTNLAMDETGQNEMFRHAFYGEAIPEALLQLVQKEQLLHWDRTASGF